MWMWSRARKLQFLAGLTAPECPDNVAKTWRPKGIHISSFEAIFKWTKTSTNPQHLLSLLLWIRKEGTMNFTRTIVSTTSQVRESINFYPASKERRSWGAEGECHKTMVESASPAAMTTRFCCRTSKKLQAADSSCKISAPRISTHS